MDEMESRIKQCMDMNERLVAEVENLKAMNERLLSENAALRNGTAQAVGGAPRPAVSYPQQKVCALNLLIKAINYLVIFELQSLLSHIIKKHNHKHNK